MFRDDDETLRRIEEALLAEEDVPEEPEAPEEPDFDLEFDAEDEDENLVVRNYANHYRAYTNQPSDVDLEDYSRQVQEPRRKMDPTIRWLTILAVTLTACIVLVLIYLMVRLGFL